MPTPVILGADDQSVYIRILDSTTFLPVTTITSASAGLALVYRKGATGAVTAITEADLATVATAHADGGMIHVDTGLYRIDLPDAAVPTIEGEVTTVSGAVTGGIILPAALVGVQPIGAPAGASVSADIAVIESQTDDIGAAGAGLTAVAIGAGGITAASIATDAIDADAIAASAVAEIADGVWDEALSGHATAGTAGAALTSAGGAADPLLNTVPGSYASGTAGHALGRIGSGRVTTTSTVAQNGDIPEIIGGATYDADDGRSFDWTDTDDSWPTLTGATVVWHGQPSDGGDVVAYSMTVVTATGSGKKVRMELTAVQTAALETACVGEWAFEIWATLQTSANKVSLVRGRVPVIAVAGP